MKIKFKRGLDIRNIPDIDSVVRLCHVVNTIQSLQRLVHRTSTESDKDVRIRDDLFLIYMSASTIHEALEKILTFTKPFLSKISQEERNEIAKLRNEQVLENAPISKALESIRNKVGFHFGDIPKVSSLSSGDLSNMNDLLSSSTGLNYNSVFPFPDQTILANVFPDGGQVDLGVALEYIGDKCNHIFELVNGILLKVMEEFVYYEKSDEVNGAQA